MFKKKGGLGFKPKLPSARPRPVPPPTTSQPAKPPASQTSVDSQSQEVATETAKTNISEPPSIDNSEKNPQNPPESIQQEPEPIHENNPPPPQPTVIPEAAPQQPSSENESGKEPSAAVPTANEVAPSVAQKESPIAQPAPVTEKPRQPVPTSAQAKVAPENVQTEVNNSQAVEESIESGQGQGEANLTEEPAIPAIGTEGAPPSPPQSQPTAPSEPTKAAKAPPKPRARRKSTKATEDEAGDEEEETRPKKRQRKTPQDAETTASKKTPRKRKSPAQSEVEGETPAQTRSRRARSLTPEDSEAQLVDLQQLKMSDLTKDLHIGRKFSRHDELRERERRKRSKSKNGDGEGSATPEPSQAPKTDTTPASSGPAPTSGPQFRIVDGQIVVDQSSLVMDRHARDKAAQGDMETVEENDFTRLITSNSFMTTSKLRGPNIWTDEETEFFYRALRMFGTDFQMISKMFPGKQRRHIKLKYNREERHNPDRITAAVVGEKTIKIDIDEYKAFTGSEFESVEVIEAEQRKMEEEFEAERKRVADEQAEIMRQKREELFADDDEDARKKKKGKKKKNTIIYGLNGEPIATEE